MAVPVQKRVEIGERALTLNFNFTTMRLAEKELGSPIHVLFADSGANVGFDALSVLWWACLNRKHRMVRDATDALVDEVGIEQVTEWITEGIAEYTGGGQAPETGTTPAPTAEPGEKGKARKA